MELQEYINNALRTESRIGEIKVNKVLLTTLLRIAITSAEMLDKIGKKHVFYGRDIDWDTILTQINWLHSLTEGMRNAVQFQRAGLTHEVDVNPRLYHACVGVFTEAGEMLEAILKHVELKKDLDIINLREEFGDAFWYLAIGIDETGGEPGQVTERNIDKLRVRFPEKFNSNQANNRDLDAERAALEGKNG